MTDYAYEVSDYVRVTTTRFGSEGREGPIVKIEDAADEDDIDATFYHVWIDNERGNFPFLAEEIELTDPPEPPVAEPEADDTATVPTGPLFEAHGRLAKLFAASIETGLHAGFKGDFEAVKLFRTLAEEVNEVMVNLEDALPALTTDHKEESV